MMRLHLYDLQKIDPEEAWDSITTKMVPFMFQIVEWTLAMAALNYFGQKTGHPLFSAVNVFLSLSLAYYLSALIRQNFDFAIWPRPVSGKRKWIEALVYAAVGSIFAGCILVTALTMSDAAARVQLF
jgi:hypothetical protein